MKPSLPKSVSTKRLFHEFCHAIGHFTTSIALHTFVPNIAPVEGEPNSKDLTFTPKYADGSRTYRVFTSNDLSEIAPWKLASDIPVTDGDEILTGVVEGVAKVEAATPDKRFYQVEATVTGGQ